MTLPVMEIAAAYGLAMTNLIHCCVKPISIICICNRRGRPPGRPGGEMLRISAISGESATVPTGRRGRRPLQTIFDIQRAHESCALFLFFCKWVLYKKMNILYNISRWKRFQFAESYNFPGKEPCDYDRTVLHRRI